MKTQGISFCPICEHPGEIDSLCVSQTWVRSSGGGHEDENFYAYCIRELLTVSDSTNYQSKLTELQSRWSPAFVDYYSSSLDAAVQSSAEFVTRHLGVAAKPYIGITNNVSESFNHVLKDFQNWKVICITGNKRKCNTCVYVIVLQ